MYFLFCVVLCIVCVYMCSELLPPGGYPIAVKYIIYHILYIGPSKFSLKAALKSRNMSLTAVNTQNI